MKPIDQLVALFQRVFGREPPYNMAEPGVLFDLLILTGDDDAYGVTIEEITGWSAANRIAVEKWASAVQMNCHNDIDVPPVPDVICERYTAFVGRRLEGG